MRRFSPLALVIAAAACGGASVEAQAPVESAPPVADEALGPAHAMAASAKTETEDNKPFGAVPTDCVEHHDNLCLPEVRFVKRLCSAPYPEVALAMFRKGTPWTRGYLRMNVEAWNASGGHTTSGKLLFDEEVLVVRHRVAGAGAVQVSGSGGGYDVLRWDGTCASLATEELSLKAPPGKAKFAKIPWRNLEEPIRSALESNDKVGKALGDRRTSCKGPSMADASAECVKADEQVSGVVVDYVRSGGTIPAPARLP